MPAPSVPASCLPVGEVPQNNELKVITVAPSLDLLYSVLSISALPKVPDNLQTLVDVNIIGFAFISNINMEAREFTILSPSPGRLPSNLLIVSTFKTDTTL